MFVNYHGKIALQIVHNNIFTKTRVCYTNADSWNLNASTVKSTASSYFFLYELILKAS